MNYNSTTTRDGIIQRFEVLTDRGIGTVSGDTDNLRDATALANIASHRVWHLIFLSTGNWQYDDGNHTDLPSATANVVLGQRRYALPSEALTVHRVEVKDKDGNWYQLNPVTKEKVFEGLDDFMDENGYPIYYRLVNGVIEIYAPTDYSQDDSLKVYFDRDSVDFAYDATTTTPGFASPYHEIIPTKMAIEWLKVKQPQSPTLGVLIQDDLKLEQSIRQFYGVRFKDYKPRVGRAKRSYK